MRLRGPPFVAFRRRLPACSTRRSTCRPFGLASAVRRPRTRRPSAAGATGPRAAACSCWQVRFCQNLLFRTIAAPVTAENAGDTIQEGAESKKLQFSHRVIRHSAFLIVVISPTGR